MCEIRMIKKKKNYLIKLRRKSEQHLARGNTVKVLAIIFIPKTISIEKEKPGFVSEKYYLSVITFQIK